MFLRAFSFQSVLANNLLSAEQELIFSKWIPHEKTFL